MKGMPLPFVNLPYLGCCPYSNDKRIKIAQKLCEDMTNTLAQKDGIAIALLNYGEKLESR